MTPRAAWNELRLGADSDAAAVRQVYADRLRGMDPDTDPAGFARLRAARDVALADIRRREAQATKPADDLAVDLDDALEEVAARAQSPAWPHAAPNVALPVPPGVVVARNDAPESPPPPAAGAATGPAETPLTIRAPAFAAPVIEVGGQGEVIADHSRGPALQKLLTGTAPDTPLDAADEARAREHLVALVRLAGHLPIERSRALEDWIAGLLVQSWTRSAPLLAPAAAAFGWDDEYGRLGERPAVAFVNARLNGLRFVEAVAKPGHRYHKAWAELSKPGFGRGWLVKQADVKALLEGIRKDFPEVEHYLDPQRIGAWERKIYPSGPVGRQGFVGALSGMRFGLILAIGGFRILIIFYNAFSHHAPPPSPPVLGPPPMETVTANLGRAARPWFGDDANFATVAQRAPLVARLSANFASGSTSQEAADRALRDGVFAALRMAALRGDSETLRAVERLRLGVLQRIPRRDTAACMEVLQSSRLPYVTDLTPDEQKRARALLEDLAKANKLDEQAPLGPLTGMIPGTMIKQIMTSAHLGEADVRKALRHEATDAVQCAVSTGLIRQALRLPAREGDPILRIE